MSSGGKAVMKKTGRSGKRKESVFAVILAAAVLGGPVLTGCGVKPHELLEIELMPGSETPESTETEPTEEETRSTGETTEALPLPHAVKPGQMMPVKSLNASNADQFFWQSAVTDEVFERINGKSYKDGADMRNDLRYLQVLHYDFDGNVRVGELICNKAISSDLLSIFHRLYEEAYPIEKIILVDEYDADDAASCSDNNTSCFNYRVITGGGSLSRHALGLAVDINPLYNPYLSKSTGICVPENGAVYTDRTKTFSHKINENDLCYRLFAEAGFTWGGSWENTPDYMHFEKEN